MQVINDVFVCIVVGVVFVGLAVKHVARIVVPEAVSGQVERIYAPAVLAVGEVEVCHGARAYLNSRRYRLVARRSNGGVGIGDVAVVHCGRIFAERPYGVYDKKGLNGFRAEYFVPHFRCARCRNYRRSVKSLAFKQFFKPYVARVAVYKLLNIIAEVILVYKSCVLVGVSCVVAVYVEVGRIFINDRGAAAVYTVVRGGAGDVALNVVVERAVNVVKVVVRAVVGARERECGGVCPRRSEVEYVFVNLEGLHIGDCRPARFIIG